MGQLTEARLGSVRMLIQSAPDHVVRSLEAMLASGAEHNEAMRLIQQLVMLEMADRRARQAVFMPLVPLFTPLRTNFLGLQFPPAALKRLWRGVKREQPRDAQIAIAAAHEFASQAAPDSLYDELCAAAGAGLRARANEDYIQAAAILDQAAPDGAALFASYLDLAQVARAALDRMPDWLGRLNEDRAVAARLAFRDAVAVAEDAGPRLLEILYAHLDEPWGVLRLISAVMHRPADQYVANSELAVFGERLLNDIEERVKLVSSFAVDRGADAGLEAGEAVRIAALEIQEFDETLELSPQGPWGSRLVHQKRTLAQAIEARFKAAEAETASALPVQSTAYKRGPRGQPRLTTDPDERHVNRARALLTLVHAVRGSAERLGFGSAWDRTSESIRSRLDPYVEDLLDKLRQGDSDEDHARVRLYLDIAAEFLGLASEEKAAQIVRRRVAAAA
jgi:hypothetical protein